MGAGAVNRETAHGLPRRLAGKEKTSFSRPLPQTTKRPFFSK